MVSAGVARGIQPFILGAVAFFTLATVTIGVLTVLKIVDEGSWITWIPWGLVVVLPVIVIVIASQMGRGQQEAARALAERGSQAPAQILQVRDTGLQVLGHPVFALKLEVRPSDAAIFDAEVTVQASLPTLHKYEPGQEVRVRYDPTDRTRVALEE